MKTSLTVGWPLIVFLCSSIAGAGMLAPVGQKKKPKPPKVVQMILSTEQSKVLHFEGSVLVDKTQGCFWVEKEKTFRDAPAYGFCCVEMGSRAPSPDCLAGKEEVLGIGETCKTPAKAKGWMTYCTRKPAAR